MEDDWFKREFDYGEKPRDSLFGWTVLILLLTGLALACWIGSFYVFGHPETPLSYKILKKLKKLDPPQRFETTSAPPGEFLTAEKLYDRYINLTPGQLAQENLVLLRNYLGNYRQVKGLVAYMTGRYTIVHTRKLTDNDFFETGVVALAQSTDFGQVIIEHLYPADRADEAELVTMLQPGLDIKMERTQDLTPVIHVEKLPDGRMQFTVVPLRYGTYALSQSPGVFSLRPPAQLNVAAEVPIIKPAMLEQAEQSYVEWRKTHGLSVAKLPGRSPTRDRRPVAELVRVDKATTPVPRAVPTPAIAAAQPTPAAPVPTPTPAIATTTATPAPTPATIAMLNPTPSNARVATPIPVATPLAVAQPGRPALQPFLAAAPTPLPINRTGQEWPTYAAGQAPPGRVVTIPDTAGLAESGLKGERIYLAGRFSVSAAGENRAILRPRAGLTAAGALETTTRIIVDYPPGIAPPAEGSTVSRDENRPLQILDIRRGSDGQVNIYTREISAP